MSARTRFLLLLPLLAAGCATAGQSASTLAPVDGAASDVRFERVSSRAVVVQVQQPVNAAFLYLRPGGSRVASWAQPGVQALAVGSHRVAVERPLSARLASGTGSRRSRPGVQVTGLPQSGPQGRVVLVDNAQPRRTDGPATGPAATRSLFVVVSALPLNQGVLEEVLAEFNEDYAGISLEAGALSRALSERLAADLPGASGYFTRLPN